MDPLQHLSILDASRITGISTDGLRARVKKGQIPVVHLGTRFFIVRRDLDEFVRSNYIPTTK